MDAAGRIAENLQGVKERIALAAQRAGRSPDEVRLVAVTKYGAVEHVEALVAAGCRDLGESRPQELWKKANALRGHEVRWHLVGHLQRNKARQTLPFVTLIHSVDSLRLLRSLDEEAGRADRRIPVLLEVNISGDAAKHGFAPEEAAAALDEASALHRVKIEGLMAMASREGGAEAARRDFIALRLLRDRLRDNCPPDMSLDQLSMGMSDDFEIAVEEGATLVRVGGALFEGVL